MAEAVTDDSPGSGSQSVLMPHEISRPPHSERMTSIRRWSSVAFGQSAERVAVEVDQRGIVDVTKRSWKPGEHVGPRRALRRGRARSRSGAGRARRGRRPRRPSAGRGARSGRRARRPRARRRRPRRARALRSRALTETGTTSSRPPCTRSCRDPERHELGRRGGGVAVRHVLGRAAQQLVRRPRRRARVGPPPRGRRPPPGRPRASRARAAPGARQPTARGGPPAEWPIVTTAARSSSRPAQRVDPGGDVLERRRPAAARARRRYSRFQAGKPAPARSSQSPSMSRRS